MKRRDSGISGPDSRIKIRYIYIFSIITQDLQIRGEKTSSLCFLNALPTPDPLPAATHPPPPPRTSVIRLPRQSPAAGAGSGYPAAVISESSGSPVPPRPPFHLLRDPRDLKRGEKQNHKSPGPSRDVARPGRPRQGRPPCRLAHGGTRRPRPDLEEEGLRRRRRPGATGPTGPAASTRGRAIPGAPRKQTTPDPKS